MNLSELLIIFVNKVLITQTKDMLLYISNMNISYHIYSVLQHFGGCVLLQLQIVPDHKTILRNDKL